ncbi:MAG: hypothetical protein KJ666_03885 [Bacteroidetes bacterium]|nr:hypothetical protein [Bacteroidota bacterium]MBU2583992.1 hypothetical protein [Bacteroidota bacterium]
MKSNKEEVRYFYVDETGDPTLFDKKGKIIVGDEGISKVFIVGVAQVTDPDYVKHELNKLRTSLVEDPYFADVPSMQPNTRKTALFFHAKDDLAEVRREVFKLLPKLNVKVHVVVRRKNEFANHVKEHFRITGKKLTPNNIYDEMISRLFRNLLHSAASRNVRCLMDDGKWKNHFKYLDIKNKKLYDNTIKQIKMLFTFLEEAKQAGTKHYKKQLIEQRLILKWHIIKSLINLLESFLLIHTK